MMAHFIVQTLKSEVMKVDYKEKFIKDMEYINNKESRKEVYIIDLLKEGLDFNYLKEYSIAELMEIVTIYKNTRIKTFKTESDFISYITNTKVRTVLECKNKITKVVIYV